MTPIKFTHSNFNTEVVLYTEKIIGVMFLPTNQTTAVLGDGGAMVPVVGTVEEVNQAILAAKPAKKTRSKK